MTGRALPVAILAFFAIVGICLYFGYQVGNRDGRADVAAQLAPEIAENQAALGAFGDRLNNLRDTLAHEGLASWYGHQESGRITASGTIFDPERFMAASKYLPFGTRWRITRLDNGASIVVEIEDDGPNVKGRAIDLSRAAAESIGMIRAGVVRVRIEPELIP